MPDFSNLAVSDSLFFQFNPIPFISSIIPSVQNVFGCQLVGHGTLVNLEPVSWLQRFCECCCIVIGCIDRYESRKKIAFVKCQVVLFSRTGDNVLVTGSLSIFFMTVISLKHQLECVQF